MYSTSTVVAVAWWGREDNDGKKEEATVTMSSNRDEVELESLTDMRHRALLSISSYTDTVGYVRT